MLNKIYLINKITKNNIKSQLFEKLFLSAIVFKDYVFFELKAKTKEMNEATSVTKTISTSRS